VCLVCRAGTFIEHASLLRCICMEIGECLFFGCFVDMYKGLLGCV
jgi:hypothetical protein